MSGLAEEEIDRSTAMLWAQRAGIALVVIGIIAGLVYLIKGLGDGATRPQRQVAKIQILPDTPPPPPPPKDEKKPEPPKEQKEVQLQQPKPQEMPQAEQMKMEGPAGDAPSAFAAGAVTNDYKGGEIGSGGGGGGVGRAAFAAYQATLQARIQERFAQIPDFRRADYRWPATVRLGEDHRVQDVVLGGSTGDAERDRLLLEELRKILAKNPPPENSPYRDFTVRVNNKLLN